MNTKVNFSKIEQCDQVWDNMDTCESGRMCSKCSHVITDFRGMSNWEIAVVHANSDQKVCGLYDKNFFNSSELIKSPIKLRKLTIPALFSLLSFAINPDIQAQSNEPQELFEPEHVAKKTNTKERANTSTDSIRIIRGFVYDENNEPLFGGNVIVKGTNYGTITDYDGSFSLDITNSINKKGSATIIVSYPSYGKQEIELRQQDFKDEVQLEMIPIIITQEEMITSFGIKRESLPKRIWRGLTSIFRKKK